MVKTSGMKFLRWFLLVGGVTAVFFIPVLQGGFLHWDDHALFVENPYFRGLGAAHWRWMCTTFLLGHWQPLSWLSYSLDYRIWMLNPQAWHVTSLLIHLFNAVLIYRLCLYCVKENEFSYSSAVLAALFWAVHPLRVETVTWLATRGYLLCTTFCLLCVFFYIRDAEQKRYPLVALLCFALATVTKGIGMMLPPVLLILDWLVLRRMDSLKSAARCVAVKIPFFTLSLLTGITAFLAKKQNGGMAPVEQYGLVERAGQAVYGIWFYLFKTISPIGLSPVYYKRPEEGAVMVAVMLAGSAAVFLFLFRRKLRPVIGTLGAFLLLIFPMLGFTQSGAQIFADRFTYLASVPFSILLAAGLSRLIIVRRTVLAAMAVILLIFGVRTFIWSEVWSDSLLLWHQSVAENGGDPRAYNGIGQALMDRKAYEKAIEYYDKALAIDSRFLAAYQNRALALSAVGQYERAFQDISTALLLEGIVPTDRAKMLLGRGQIAEKLGWNDLALADYNLVMGNPEFDPFWRTLALQVRAKLYLTQGRLNEGKADLEEVLKQFDPSDEHHRNVQTVLDGIKKIPGE